MKKVGGAIVVLLFMFGGSIALNYIIGKDAGQPCSDSYRCRGYLIAGAQCLNDGGRYYCSKSCDSDSDCPAQWSCALANKTHKGMTTSATLNVCVRLNWGDCSKDEDCGEGWKCFMTPGLGGSCHPKL